MVAEPTVRSTFKPNINQAKLAVLVSTPVDHGGPLYPLVGGAIRGGKSYSGCQLMVDCGLQFPGNRILIGRKDFDDLWVTTMVDFFRILPPEAIGTPYNKTEHTLTLTNGTVYIFHEMKDIDSIKSFELGAYFVDQAEEVEEEYILMLQSRLSWRLPNGRYPRFIGLLSANPAPGYLKKRYYDRWKTRTLNPLDAYIPFLPADNLQNLPPNWMELNTSGRPETWVKRYIRGQWDAFEGQFFDNFDLDVHVIEPLRMDYFIRRVRGFDHGLRAPTACLWGLEIEGDIILYREYYEGNQLPSYHSDQVIKLSKDEFYDYSSYDPALNGVYRENEGVHWTWVDEYRQLGLMKTGNWIPGTKDRMPRYAEMKRRLVIEPTKYHRFSGKLGAPSIYIMRNCEMLLEELPAMSWKSAAEEEDETLKKGFDHAIDASTYLILPARAQKRLPNKVRPAQDFEMVSR